MNATTPPLFFASEIFRTSRHASGHPLAIPRVSLCVDLCRSLDWLPDTRYRECGPASVEQLRRFHDQGYIDAVMRAERNQALSEADQRRYNLGINGNPIYGEVFRRPATACGASLAAAAAIFEGGVGYNPAGGTHHGRRAAASGYCVFNDPVLAILALLDAGLGRIFYLDLDAHFGDGVQLAFAPEPRVFTLSIHERGRWPMTRGGEAGPGSATDRAAGRARNCPVPPGFSDSELAFLMSEVVLPLIEAEAPDALVVQCGTDALADDPMTGLALSNGALWAAIASVMGRAPRLLVLGGGGYNPWAVARCWAGVWATLSRQAIPEALPAASRELLARVSWRHRLGRNPPERWHSTLVDPPNPERVREEIVALAATARAS